MNKIKPSLPTGVKDLGPKEIFEREYVLKIIKKNFQVYGFVPIETPAIENISSLTEKYGEEGDKLIYKIINSGDYLKKVTTQDFNMGYKYILPKICSKALRYDLTVPLSRYISMNQERHPFPFRRYQIQPVWRADRPQKGRFREFYQCDVDIVGVISTLSEAEILVMIGKILKQLKIPNFKIKVNHRKILKAFAEYIQEPKKENILAVSIDKIDKIGLDKVIEELEIKGINKPGCRKLRELLLIKNSNSETLSFLKEKLRGLNSGEIAIKELKELIEYTKVLDMDESFIEIDTRIARGLAYYTGTIFEVIVEDINIGSIGGGGRYESLTEIFGLKDCPGFGFAFGLDRIHQVMKELDLLPELKDSTTKVLLANFDSSVQTTILKLATELRSLDIVSEIYPNITTLKKQLSYANKKKIQYVIFVGPEEQKNSKFVIKNMKTGEQILKPINEASEHLKLLTKK